MRCVQTAIVALSIAALATAVPSKHDLEQILIELTPSRNEVCLSHEHEFAVCMGNDATIMEMYSSAVVKCSMTHVDVFSEEDGFTGLPCDLKQLLGTIEMKTCMYTEFKFFALETGFDVTAIADFYSALPIADLFEDDFAQTCVDGALMITETNIMGAIKLIISGSFDFSELEDDEIEDESIEESGSSSGSSSGKSGSSSSKSGSSSHGSTEETVEATTLGFKSSALFEIDAFLALVHKTVTFNCIDMSFKNACSLHVTKVLFGEADPATMPEEAAEATA